MLRPVSVSRCLTSGCQCRTYDWGAWILPLKVNGSTSSTWTSGGGTSSFAQNNGSKPSLNYVFVHEFFGFIYRCPSKYTTDILNVHTVYCIKLICALNYISLPVVHSTGQRYLTSEKTSRWSSCIPVCWWSTPPVRVPSRSPTSGRRSKICDGGFYFVYGL